MVTESVVTWNENDCGSVELSQGRAAVIDDENRHLTIVEDRPAFGYTVDDCRRIAALCESAANRWEPAT